MKKQWYVYILLCKNGKLYTGVTSDLDRRFKLHASGGGSKAVRAFGGVDKYIYSKTANNLGEALRMEHAIKKLDVGSKFGLACGIGGMKN